MKEDELGYWQIVSQGMDLEDRKLRMFVKHKASLGVGRENILRKFLAEQTPEPLRVSTGFMVHPGNPEISSAQCDVLVYDPRRAQPLYRIEEFVVVPAEVARLAIEVRSSMSVSKKSGVDQVFRIHESIRGRFPASVFGFGFKGPIFETFLRGIAERVKGEMKNVPECIVVHRKNYLCIRVGAPNLHSPHKHVCLAIDFGQLGPKAQGYATALFLWCYHQRLTWIGDFNAPIVAIHARDMGIPSERLRIIRTDGTIVQCDEPDIMLKV